MASSPPPPEEPEAQPKESPATKARFETFYANKDGSLRGEEIVKMLTAMGCASPRAPQSHSNVYAPYRTFRTRGDPGFELGFRVKREACLGKQIQ